MIRTDGLGVAFGRTVALEELDLEIGDGVFGLFGPNGSGKSTLLRAAAGLLRPSSGSISWRGRPIAVGEESFRRQVGYAGHASGLYGRLSLAENLAVLARLYGVPHDRPREVVAGLGLEAVVRRPVSDLSAGLRRRAAVSRALLHEPSLLLLDEPYANLDDDAAETISSAVRAWRGPARTALIATHGAKRLKGWADGGVILRRGRVVVSGRYKAGPEASSSRGGRG